MKWGLIHSRQWSDATLKGKLEPEHHAWSCSRRLNSLNFKQLSYLLRGVSKPRLVRHTKTFKIKQMQPGEVIAQFYLCLDGGDGCSSHFGFLLVSQVCGPSNTAYSVCSRMSAKTAKVCLKVWYLHKPFFFCHLLLWCLSSISSLPSGGWEKPEIIFWQTTFDKLAEQLCKARRVILLPCVQFGENNDRNVAFPDRAFIIRTFM